MEFEMTRRQVARGTQPDGETFDTLVLVKKVSELRATYQVRLLIYRATQENKKLLIDIPKECTIHDDLKRLAKEFSDNVAFVRH